LNYEQLKKTVGMRVQLVPVAHRLDDAGKVLPQIDDDWLVESVHDEHGVRISNPRTGLYVVLGLDHIHSYASNPNRREGGLKFGFYTLKVQLTLTRHEVIVRPNLRPGESVPPPQTISPKSPPDRLARLAAEKDFERKTEMLATSREAFDAVEAMCQVLYARISETISRYAGRSIGSLQGESGFKDGVYGANLGPIGCLINYQNSFGNVTAGTLTIRFLRDRIAIPGSNQILLGFPTEISRIGAKVSRSQALGWCWIFRGQPRTSEEVADFVLDEFTRLNR
jgi:hypothetical protein